MNDAMTDNLVFPLVTWASPPEHTISAIFLSSEAAVTGSTEGHLCVWKISASPQRENFVASPTFVLIGHEDPIVSVFNAAYAGSDCFVTIDAKGTVCIWDQKDGFCHSVATQLQKLRPLSACVFPNRRHVAVIGESSDIEITDLWTSDVVETIHVNRDWIAACCAFEVLKGNPRGAAKSESFSVLMAIHRDFEVRYWSVGENGEVRSAPILSFGAPTSAASESVNSSSIKLQSNSAVVPLCVAMSPNLSVYLLVTDWYWQLVSVNHNHVLLEVSAPEQEDEDKEADDESLRHTASSSLLRLLGGKFIDDRNVIVWTTGGRFFQYSIPDSNKESSILISVLEKEKLTPLTKTISGQLTVTAQKAPSTPSASRISNSGNAPPQETPPARPVSPRPSPSIHRRTASATPSVPEGSQSGVVIPSAISFTAILRYVYRTDSKKKKKKMQLKNRNNVNNSLRSISFPSWTTDPFPYLGSCADDESATLTLWKLHVDESFRSEASSRVVERIAPAVSTSISAGWPQQGSKAENKITATLVLEDDFLFISGYEHGEISTSNLPFDSTPHVFVGHLARVTCLCRPADLNGKRILLSGSIDTTIKVWDLTRRELLHVFAQHTASVTHILQPTEFISSENKWRGCFLSVGDDKSVCLFSLENMLCKHIFGGHSGQICAVRWRFDQDLLIVGCTDGSVSIWDIASGTLEGKASSEETCDIYVTCEDLLTRDASQRKYQPRAVSTSVIHRPHGLPIQIVAINLKRLLPDLKRPFLKKLEEEKAKVAYPSPSSPAVMSAVGSTPERTRSPPPLSPLPSTTCPSAPQSPAEDVSRIRKDDLRLRAFSLEPSPLMMSTSPLYAFLSYLMPWGQNKQLDSTIQKELLLSPPSGDQSSLSFALRGEEGHLSVLVPAQSARLYSISGNFTAMASLCGMTAAKALLAQSKNAANLLILQHCSILATEKAYVPPSIFFLANYWRDTIDEVLQASRTLLTSSLEKLPAEYRKSLIAFCTTQMKLPAEFVKVRSRAVIALGILATEIGFVELMPEAVSHQLALELVMLLNQDSTTLLLPAIELIGKGFKIWRNYILDIPNLLRRLLSLASASNPPNISAAATAALLAMGQAEVKDLLGAMSKAGQSARPLSAAEWAAALTVLSQLIRTSAAAVVMHIITFVEISVRALDPAKTEIRSACIKPATSLIQAMVKRFPMVSFHADTQRLAAAANAQAAIAIYDLKTASRWHVLEGHLAPVCALAFAPSGKALASYSIEDCTVRLWQTTTGFLGLNAPKCIQKYSVPKVDRIIQPTEILEGVRLEWVPSGVQGMVAIQLTRSWDPQPVLFQG